MIIKQCEHCGIEFNCYPSSNKRYCSKSCYASHQKIWERTPSFHGIGNIGYTGRTHSEETKQKISKSCKGKGRPKDERTIVFCELCGAKVEKLPYYLDKREHHFCSQECWHKWNKGKNHVCYDETLQREYVGFTDELKQTIRLRDKVCQICKKEKRLSVHHIDCDKHNPNPQNLICLCASCHTRVHMNIKEWTGYLTKIIEDLYND